MEANAQKQATYTHTPPIAMRHVRTILSIAIAAVMLATFPGCGMIYNSRRTDLLESASPSDWGPPPPEGHRAIEEKLILSSLKDPNSAQLSWGESKRDIIQKGFASPTPVLVWVTRVSVNAKNSYGGYTGFKQYRIAWRDERLYAHAFESGFWSYVD